MKVKALSKISIHHSDHLDNKYTVSEKPFPDNLQTTYNGKSIRWITNFGYQRKENSAEVKGQLEENYDIEIEKDSNPNAVLVYFDGASVKELTTRPSDTTPGKIKATLNLGDPPVGWAG
jgi:hypothetical protein